MYFLMQHPKYANIRSLSGLTSASYLQPSAGKKHFVMMPGVSQTPIYIYSGKFMSVLRSTLGQTKIKLCPNDFQWTFWTQIKDEWAINIGSMLALTPQHRGVWQKWWKDNCCSLTSRSSTRQTGLGQLAPEFGRINQLLDSVDSGLLCG